LYAFSLLAVDDLSEACASPAGEEAAAECSAVRGPVAALHGLNGPSGKLIDFSKINLDSQYQLQ
jgi:hypothetical protein